MPSILRGPFLLVLAFGAACHTPRPSELPRDEAWIVAVKSCRLPTWLARYTRFAQHSWIDVKGGDDEHWRRIEVSAETSGVVTDAIGPKSAYLDWRWTGCEVRTLTTIYGERARTIAATIAEHARRYDEFFKQQYDAWPGPNSNTLVWWLARDVPEFACTLDHNALGKDYTSSLYLGSTASKTGLRFDAYVVGCALAAREGLELHLLGLTFGLQLWPPRLQLPGLPELPWPARPRGSPSKGSGDEFAARIGDAIADADTHEIHSDAGTPSSGFGPIAFDKPTKRIVVGCAKPESWIAFKLSVLEPCSEAPRGGVRAEIRANAPGLHKANVAWQELFELDEHDHFRSPDYGIVGGGIRAGIELERDEQGHLRGRLHTQFNAQL